MQSSNRMTPTLAQHRLALMLGRMRDQRWSTGDSLGRIALQDDEAALLEQSVRVLLEYGVGRLSSADRTRWGAAMLLVGARALRQLSEGPFTYERIGEVLDIPDLKRAIAVAERDALEAGAGFWRIELMRIRTQSGQLQRRLLGTMIRQSGAGWVLLEALAALVPRRWSWAGVDTAEVDTVAGWIAQCVERRYLGRKMARALEGEEARHALAGRLQDMAAVWAMLSEAGVTALEPALQAFGKDDPMSWLDAPDEPAARRMLEHLCERPAEDASGEIRWRWFADGRGREGVVIELPQRLRLPDVPEDADRVRLQVLDGVSDQTCLYGRQAKVFEHRQGARRLRPPVAPFEQVMVVAQYRHGHELGEVVAAELDMPAAPVAVFDTHSGRLLRSPQPGTRIALVPRPGWSMRPPEGFAAHGTTLLQSWVGMMPAETTQCIVTSPDGEEVRWVLSSTAVSLDIVLMNAIAGLRLEGVPVVQGAPLLRVGLMRGRGTCSVRRADGTVLMDDEAVMSRGGRVQLPMDEWPSGIYRLSVAFDGRERSMSIAVLPSVAEIDIHSDGRGTHVVLSGGGIAAHLLLRDATPVQSGDGSLLLGPEVRGAVVVGLTVTSGGNTWVGTWSLRASPQVVEVVDSTGESPKDNDLGLLRGGGGLRIHGRPRRVVQVQVAHLRFLVRLSPDGERVFPFTMIPANLLQKDDERFTITLYWSDGHTRRLPFTDPGASRLTARLVPAEDGQAEPRLRVFWKRAIAGEVHVEALRAWQPWEPAVSLPAAPAAWDDKIGYEATFSLPVGGYQVVLMNGARRVSGVTLVCSPDGELRPPPDELTALERELWSEPNTGRLAALLEEHAHSGDDARFVPGVLRTLARYGVRWFKIAKVLVNITGQRRLEALLREDEPTELDRLIEHYYEQMGVSWMCVRERDLARMSEVLAGMGDGHANALLRSVAEQSAGLLVPAARHWQRLLSFSEQHMSDTADLQRLYNSYDSPRPLNHAELDCLRETDVHTGDANEALADTPTVYPRLRGLLELRRFRDAFGMQPVMRELPPAPLDDKWFSKMPERVQELERAVARLAWEVHRWRRGGHLTTSRMQEITRLEPLAQHSFDYWLNAWDGLGSTSNGG